MYTYTEYTVYMKKNTVKQYTLRNIPKEIDVALKKLVLETGKSFNQIAVATLINGCNYTAKIKKRDLSDISGTLSEEEAKLIELEIKRQHQIDPSLWS